MTSNPESHTSNIDFNGIDFTGWRLADVQAELQNSGHQIQIVETAPPFQKRGFTQVWGEMRVLRHEVLRHAEKEDAIKLVVARELLKELKAPELKTQESHLQE